MSNENENTVNDPQAEYVKQFTEQDGRVVTFFSSFEQENEYTYKMYASLTPEQCLANVTRRRLMNYPYLNHNMNPWGDTIYFQLQNINKYKKTKE